nr:DUF5689 domain-containing protein [uncultured Flavobacterium sp.]
MKQINIKGLLILPLLAATMSGCVNGDDYNTPDNLSELCTTLTVTKQVQDITALSTTTYQQYTDEDIIEAYVTSSDEGGNFYKSISMVSVDGTVGFSMPVDAYNLYTKFEPGRKVYVNMKDRYFVTENSSTVIGSLYNNGTPENALDDEVGRISGVEYQNVIKRSCEDVNEDEIVKHLTITQAKNNQNLNMLIEFDAVQFTDASLGKKYFDPTVNNLGGATNHLITDAAGNKIIVRVSEFATFAQDYIPSENGKIRGVLTKFGSDFQFMVRTLNDVKLTNSRIVPLFEETFSSTFPNWTKFSVTGAQVWTLESAFGNPVPCAKMSGYASGNQNNEDWLISPAINLSSVTSATLTFDTATKFAGNALQVYISTNYSGSGNPSAATWTPVSATLSPTGGNFVWTSSGAIDLAPYIGNTIYIGYKYTSTTAAAATWEVDNVKIIGG